MEFAEFGGALRDMIPLGYFPAEQFGHNLVVQEVPHQGVKNLAESFFRADGIGMAAYQVAYPIVIFLDKGVVELVKILISVIEYDRLDFCPFHNVSHQGQREAFLFYLGCGCLLYGFFNVGLGTTRTTGFYFIVGFHIQVFCCLRLLGRWLGRLRFHPLRVSHVSIL